MKSFHHRLPASGELLALNIVRLLLLVLIWVSGAGGGATVLKGEKVGEEIHITKHDCTTHTEGAVTSLSALDVIPPLMHIAKLVLFS